MIDTAQIAKKMAAPLTDENVWMRAAQPGLVSTTNSASKVSLPRRAARFMRPIIVPLNVATLC